MVKKFTIDPRTLVNWTTNTNYRIEVTEGLVREVGNNRSFSPAVSNQETFITFPSGPYVTTASMALSTLTNASTATITYNRSLRNTTNGGNFYLMNTSSQIIKTFNSLDPEVNFDGDTKVKIDLSNLVLPEGSYYLNSDSGIFSDNFNFPSIGEVIIDFSSTSTKILYITSISNMKDRNYSGDHPSKVFSLDIPQIIDIDPDLEKIYTITLYSSVGEFINSSIGSTINGVWVASTTKAIINDAFKDIEFISTSPTGNADGTYTYSLEKSNISLVSKTLGMFGIPFILGGDFIITSTNMTITSSSYSIVPLHTSTVEITSSTRVTRIYSTPSNTSTFWVWTDPNYIQAGTEFFVIGEFSPLPLDGEFFTIDSFRTVPNSPISFINFSPSANLSGYLMCWPGIQPVETIEVPGIKTCRHWYKDVPLTAILTTSTQFNGTESGMVSFELVSIDGVSTGTQQISTSTFNNNVVNSPSVQFPSTGTYVVRAVWEGRQIPPKYYGRNSDDLAVFAEERALYPGTMTLSGPSTSNRLGYTTLTLTGSENTSTTGTFNITISSKIGNGTGTTTTTNLQVIPNQSISLVDSATQVTFDGRLWLNYGGNPEGTSYSTSSYSTLLSKDTTTSINTSTSISDDGKITITNINTVTVTNSSLIVTTTKTINGKYLGILSGQAYITSPRTGDNFFDCGVPTTPLINRQDAVLRNGNNYFYTVYAGNSSDSGGYDDAGHYVPNQWRTWTVIPGPDGIIRNANARPNNLLTPTEWYPTQTQYIEQTVQRFNKVENEESIYTITENTGISFENTFTGNFTGSNVASIVIENEQIFGGSIKTAKAMWNGQEFYADPFYYPYYATATNAISFSIIYDQLSLSGTSENSILLDNTYVLTLNTSSHISNTVSLYNGESLITNVSIPENTSSMVVVVPAGILPINPDGHTIKAILTTTNTTINSNVITTRVYDLAIPTLTVAVSTSSYNFYNIDGTLNSGNIIANVQISHPNPSHIPTGIYSLYVDDILVSTSTVNSSIVSFNIDPTIYGTAGTNMDVRIVYQGDDWNTSASSTAIVSLNKNKPVISASSSTWIPSGTNAGKYLNPMTFNAIFPVANKAPSNVDWYINDSFVQNTPVINGSSTFVDNVRPAGIENISASYVDSEIYSGITSTSVILVDAFAVSLNSTASSSHNFLTGYPIEIKTTHNFTGFNMNGTVILTNLTTGQQVSTGTFVGSTSTIYYVQSTEGLYDFQISYIDPRLLNSYGNILNLNFAKEQSYISLAVTNTNYLVGEKIYITATETNSRDLGGTITFYDQGTYFGESYQHNITLGTSTFDSSGKAYFEYTVTRENSFNIVGVYSGDSNFSTTTTNYVAFAKKTTTMEMLSPPYQSPYPTYALSDQLTLSASTTATSHINGIVEFVYDNGVVATTGTFIGNTVTSNITIVDTNTHGISARLVSDRTYFPTDTMNWYWIDSTKARRWFTGVKNPTTLVPTFTNSVGVVDSSDNFNWNGTSWSINSSYPGVPKIYYPDTATFSVVVSGGKGTPTGNILVTLTGWQSGPGGQPGYVINKTISLVNGVGTFEITAQDFLTLTYYTFYNDPNSGRIPYMPYFPSSLIGITYQGNEIYNNSGGEPNFIMIRKTM